MMDIVHDGIRAQQMEELTLEEIIKYSMRVHQDSFIFYRRASKRMGNDLRILANELADHKAQQLRELKDLLSECIINEEDLSQTEDVETSSFDEILENGHVPIQATPRDVLYLILEREKHLKSTYELILGFRSLNPRMHRVFEKLMSVACEQITHIRKKLEG
jgi:rubrerythrin